MTLANEELQQGLGLASHTSRRQAWPRHHQTVQVLPSGAIGNASAPPAALASGDEEEVLPSGTIDNASTPSQALAAGGEEADSSPGRIPRGPEEVDVQRPALLRHQQDHDRSVGSSHRLLPMVTSDLDPDVLRVGEGVGAMTYDRSPTGNRKLNHELRRRLAIQDLATLLVLVLFFGCTVTVTFLSIYHVAKDPSPVTFYCDPRRARERIVSTATDVEGFLQSFNTQPEVARLRIIGRTQRQESRSFYLSLRNMELQQCLRELQLQLSAWLLPGRRILHSRRQPWDPVLFDVTLDLAPFITGAGRLASQADNDALERHLSSVNPLEVLVIQKRVQWSCWEDVATNIRQRFRTLGFAGEVEVQFLAQEDMVVYRNHPWQNFVRSRITQAVVMLSVIGALFWFPYLWLRSRKVRVETRFHISLDLPRYWDLLAQGLHPQEGFQGQPFSIRPPSRL